MFAEKIGKSIIMKHHKYFISEEGESDDLEHITAIKRTITGLIDFSRDLFLDSCIEVAMEDYDE